MNCEILEKILTLFDNCKSRGEPLELHIPNDLLKILPFPSILILNLLIDQPTSAISYLSNDQNILYFQNNLSLCERDQNESGACKSLSCKKLHICKDFLLNNYCSQFNLNGKCLYSHTLSTKHNENILEKFQLSLDDKYILQFISHLTQLSLSLLDQSFLIVQTINGLNITDYLIDQWLDQHKSLLINKILINSNTIQLIFEDAEVTSMMENFLKKNHSKTALIKSNLEGENKYFSNINNDQQEKELDKEIQLTNQQIPIRSNRILKSNDINSYSSEQLIRKNFGRGRDRQELNRISHSPSLNNSLLKNSPNTFSRRLASNDQIISTNEKKLSFSHRLQSIPNEQIKKNSPDNLSSQQIIHTDPSSDKFSKFFLPKIPQQHNQNNDIHNNLNENTSPILKDTNSRTHFVLRKQQISNKETSPILINYVYNKQFTDEQLCYLLGPGRKHINQKDQYEILSGLPSGYCRLTNIEQGKDIEKSLYSILPKRFKIDLININDQIAFISSSSIAEKIFQQNQIHYAIISEPSKTQLNIEIIHECTNQNRRSSSPPNNISSLSSTIDNENNQQFSSDRIFYINKTNSSMNVISGNISEVPVDLMICISTSNNLCNSVLRSAGAKIESQYKDRYQRNDALLLDGGSTTAKKILFVPWETEIIDNDTRKIQKSLSDLVKWCIEQAHERNMKSISFPPIGTGQLGLDPAVVCEAMISAASERLHQYKIDVKFVIYSSNNNDDDECYQIFRIYLDSLCEQVKSTNISTIINSNERKISNTFDTKKQLIRRDVQSKRLLTLSDYENMNEYHNILIKLLEKLIIEKIYDISLIESSLLTEIDLLINICLKYNTIPRIDFPRRELILYGDYESCFQCFFNIRQEKKFYQYNYVLIENGEKSDEIYFNRYISLKIDEAFINGESNICIKDNDKMSYDIDLNRLQVKINRNKQSAYLVKKPLNSKINIPLSWSSSLLMIRTNEIKRSSFQSLECFQIFQETMSINDWQIERIDAIENYPLYIHFMNNKKDKTKLYFHGCSYSSVQSIIHYGLHSTNASNYGDHFKNSSNESICLTRDILSSHLYGTRRSTDGKHYLFAVEIAKNDINNNDFILLSNEDIHLTLPTYLIVYQRRNHF